MSVAKSIVLGMVVVVLLLSATVSTASADVYWAVRDGGSGTTIGRANSDGTEPDPSFITGATGPVGVAVDGSHVYWANTFGSGTTIGRANLDGSGVNQSFITGAHGPCGVAVDANHLYWANNATGTIGRANLDGSGVNQSFITGADRPCGVAVDGSHVYWANEGTCSPTCSGTTIGRANLDGSAPNESFITGLAAPVGVAVNSSFIYWGNDNVGTIGRASLDGTGVNDGFIAGSGGCTDFPALDASHIYWANDCDSSVGRANLDGTGVNNNFVATAPNPGGVAVDLPRLTASLVGSGSGSVTGPGISCPGTCSAGYPVGQQVTLTATPAAGSSFAGWSGAGCSGTGNCTVTLSSDQTVTATFSATPKPSCAIKAKSKKVLLPPAKKTKKKKAKGKPGTLSFTVVCSQGVSVKLTGRVTATIHKTKHHKKRKKAFTVKAVHSTLAAGSSRIVTVKLPKGAIAALRAGDRESGTFTMTATNAQGTTTTTDRIARLRAVKR